MLVVALFLRPPNITNSYLYRSPQGDTSDVVVDAPYAFQFGGFARVSLIIGGAAVNADQFSLTLDRRYAHGRNVSFPILAPCLGPSVGVTDS